MTDDLPDTTKWLPRVDAAATLKASFVKRCAGVEQVVQLRSEIERRMNTDNFDAGPGVEEIIREQFATLLPGRYSVRCGVVSDRSGHTAGDCDLLVFNDGWFPAVKSGAAVGSRRVHFPIDGVYAVGEIKSSLDAKTLDEAMRKLVVAHRLERPATNAYRITENREGSACSHGKTNPLYSFVLATALSPSISFDKLIERFIDINKTLRRSEVVRGLCVLGVGAVVWGFRDPARGGELRPARFMLEDLYLPVIPFRFDATASTPALYALISNLLLHLYHSLLAPEDIAAAFGPASNVVRAPNSKDVCLQPDPDKMISLSHRCKER